jgi:hypothetical protein
MGARNNARIGDSGSQEIRPQRATGGHDASGRRANGRCYSRGTVSQLGLVAGEGRSCVHSTRASRLHRVTCHIRTNDARRVVLRGRDSRRRSKSPVRIMRVLRSDACCTHYRRCNPSPSRIDPCTDSARRCARIVSRRCCLRRARRIGTALSAGYAPGKGSRSCARPQHNFFSQNFLTAVVSAPLSAAAGKMLSEL